MSNLPSLYILSEEYRQAAEKLADLDLPAEVIADTLESIAGDLESKAVNVAMFVRNLEATAEQIKAAELAMGTRRKAIETRAEQVRKYLKDGMINAGISKIECPLFRLSIKQNPPSVVIDSEQAILPEFMRRPEPPPPSPDKTAIKEALKNGVDVPGAYLTTSQRLEIK